MRNRSPGCLSASGLIAVAVTLLLVLAFSYLRGGRLFSPGPLNAQAVGTPLGGISTHADLGGRCAACHTPFWSGESMSDRCLDCHASVAQELSDSSGLHGTIAEGTLEFECRQCHTEHRGPEASLTILDVSEFPHEALGFAMSGHSRTAAGAAFDCEDCHTDGLREFSPERCVECHVEIDSQFMEDHEGDFGPSCLDCHDGVDSFGSGFSHDQTDFPLVGEHAESGCAGCHAGSGDLLALQETPQECYACHASDDAHEGDFGTDCAACHTPEDWESAAVDHDLTGFPLEGAHTEVACEDCHTGGVFRGTSRECAACHTEPAFHQGLFPAQCDTCHTTEAWQPADFNLAHSFPINHGDQLNSCTTCHPSVLREYTCFSCHEHQPAEMVEEHQEEGISDIGNCAGCHPNGLKDEAED
jgi:hypothetical protein